MALLYCILTQNQRTANMTLLWYWQNLCFYIMLNLLCVPRTGSITWWSLLWITLYLLVLVMPRLIRIYIIQSQANISLAVIQLSKLTLLLWVSLCDCGCPSCLLWSCLPHLVLDTTKQGAGLSIIRLKSNFDVAGPIFLIFFYKSLITTLTNTDRPSDVHSSI